MSDTKKRYAARYGKEGRLVRWSRLRQQTLLAEREAREAANVKKENTNASQI